jgi:hypothetical protein
LNFSFEQRYLKLAYRCCGEGDSEEGGDGIWIERQKPSFSLQIHHSFKNSFIEIQHVYHTIDPFKVYNSMIFSRI